MICKIHGLEYCTKDILGEYCCASCKSTLLELLGLKSPDYIMTNKTVGVLGK